MGHVDWVAGFNGVASFRAETGGLVPFNAVSAVGLIISVGVSNKACDTAESEKVVPGKTEPCKVAELKDVEF